MAYYTRRRVGYRKRTYRKRTYRKRAYRKRTASRSRSRRPMGGSFMKRARTRAYANVRTGGLLAIERKFLDFGYLATGITNGGTGVANNAASTFSPAVLGPTVYRSATGTILTQAPVALNVIGQGDSGSDRDGRQVINDSIHIRGAVSLLHTADFGSGSTLPVVNIVLVLDTQTNGGTPAGSSIFVNPGDFTASGTSTGQAPFVNLSNSKRFRILKHIRRPVGIATGAYNSGAAVSVYTGGFVFSMDIPLKQMKTNYVSDSAYANGSGPTNASIGDNGLFLFAWSNRVANDVVVSYNSRLRFRG